MKILLALLVGVGVDAAVRAHGFTVTAPNYDESGKPIPGTGNVVVAAATGHTPAIAGVLAAAATYVVASKF